MTAVCFRLVQALVSSASGAPSVYRRSNLGKEIDLAALGSLGIKLYILVVTLSHKQLELYCVKPTMSKHETKARTRMSKGVSTCAEACLSGV